MVTKVQKWGNSLGLRIPKSCADEVSVEAGSSVDISVEKGRLVVRPVRGKRLVLRELLSGVKAGNLHGEIGTGAVGREVW